MITKYIALITKGNCDIIDITLQLKEIAEEEKVDNGILCLSVKIGRAHV